MEIGLKTNEIYTCYMHSQVFLKCVSGRGSAWTSLALLVFILFLLLAFTLDFWLFIRLRRVQSSHVCPNL